MPITVETVASLQQYIQGVMGRAEHHANNVDEICLAIAGAIVWRTDGDLKVRTHDGEMANVLWMQVGGSKYALSYNHDERAVEVRKDSIRGDVLASFTNESSIGDVKSFFGGL